MAIARLAVNPKLPSFTPTCKKQSSHLLFANAPPADPTLRIMKMIYAKGLIRHICLNGLNQTWIQPALTIFAIFKEHNMDSLVNLIVYLVVFGLIWWLVSLLPLPSPVAQVVRVLFIILLILIVLSVFGIIPGGYLPRLSL